MIERTTPTHSFSLPISADRIAAVRITYAQGGVVVLQKETVDCVLDGRMIRVTLSQDDTAKFRAGTPVVLQLNVKTVDGKRLASRQFTVACDDNLDDGVM